MRLSSSEEAEQDERITRALAAADAVFNQEDGDLQVPEPSGRAAVEAAVRRLGVRYLEMPGIARKMMARSGDAAASLSSDPLQGLSEIIQNADDLDASEVRFLLRDGELLAAHNGTGVALPDLVALATPWLTTKTEDAQATGRFGIGLMTLRSLSPSLEIHSGDYHVRFGHPPLAIADEIEVPADFASAGWTVLRLPLGEGALTIDALDQWLGQREDLTLLFLRHVRRVCLSGRDLAVARKLELRREPAAAAEVNVGGRRYSAAASRVTTSAGERWEVLTATIPSPHGVHRTRKATGPQTTIAVAVPLDAAKSGFLYAGLPIEAIGLPVRVNAQFDPVASRQQLDATPWNHALLPLISDLWAEAVLRLFTMTPRAAWNAVPLPRTNHDGSALSGALELKLLAAARTHVSRRCLLAVPEHGPLALTDLAVEDVSLTAVLTPQEIAHVAACRAALPQQARDENARWRSVLQDWQGHGGAATRSVSVLAALSLLDNAARTAEATVALAAAAIGARCEIYLSSHAYLIDTAGARHRPSEGGTKQAFTRQASGLGAELNLAHVLHPAYFAQTESASTVRGWLQRESILINGERPRAILQRLAELGKSRKLISTDPLTDAQIRELRDVFAALSQAERERLGPDVGRAILLRAQCYGKGNSAEEVPARPSDAYLPARLDSAAGRDSFAAAAGRTPGLVWLLGRYTEVLSAGSTGLGPTAFLRLLGAEAKPRLKPVGERKYTDAPRGLRAEVGGHPGRTAAINALGAEYTIDDYESPDLQTVAEAIARERDPGARRARAIALIDTLGRGWSDYESRNEARAAHAYYGWNPRGAVPAYWVWALRASLWIDDDHGKPRKPEELRDRTPSNIAIYGHDASMYVSREIHAASRNRIEVLQMLGIEGEATVPQLLTALRALRDPHGTATTGADQHEHPVQALILYQALSDRLASRSADNPMREEIRKAFNHGTGLVLTQSGWRTPDQCLTGHPVFGTWRNFAPVLEGTSSLWRVLGIKSPDAEHALEVLNELAPKTAPTRQSEPDPETRGVILETLKLLTEHVRTGRPLPADRCRRLPVWTSQGWRRGRPVYAVEDISIADALSTSVPVWQPGAELQNFLPLLPVLKITLLTITAATPHVLGSAVHNQTATDLLAAAVGHLRDDLRRNQPSTAASLTCAWDKFEHLTVSIAPELRSVVTLPDQPEAIEVPVDAAVDWPAGVLYVTELSELGRPRPVGRALASRFEKNQRDVANAWADAFNQAEKGRRAEELRLAEDRTRELHDDAAILVTERTDEVRQEIADRHAQRAAGNSAPAAATASPRPSASRQPGSSPTAKPSPAQPATARSLIDAKSLHLINPSGTVTRHADPTQPSQGSDSSRRRSSMPSPRAGSAVPQQHKPARPFTALDLEQAPMDLVRKAIALGPDELRDLRAQRSLGADAADGIGRLYEIKAFAGAASDVIGLTAAEFRQAHENPGFFLVIVSGLEAGTTTPTVRFITHPLRQLRLVQSAGVTLAGVRTATAIEYQFSEQET